MRGHMATLLTVGVFSSLICVATSTSGVPKCSLVVLFAHAWPAMPGSWKMQPSDIVSDHKLFSSSSPLVISVEAGWVGSAIKKLLFYVVFKIETTNLDHNFEVGGRGRSWASFPAKAGWLCLKNPVGTVQGASDCCAKGSRQQQCVHFGWFSYMFNVSRQVHLQAT